jgi:hypothetical protein
MKDCKCLRWEIFGNKLDADHNLRLWHVPITVGRATQSPRAYANKPTTQCHLSVVKSSDIYISMSIYHCISLDRGLKLPDFRLSRTEALINAFSKCQWLNRLTTPPSPKPTTGLRFSRHSDVTKIILHSNIKIKG